MTMTDRERLRERWISRATAACILLLALVVVRYLFPDEFLHDSRHEYLLRILPSGTASHPEFLRFLILGIGVPAFLWALGVFDRR